MKQMNQHYNFFDVRRLIVVFAVILLVSYGIFNARNLIMGPSIDIFSPAREIETEDSTIIVKGQVKNMTYLSLNERPISVNKEGVFEEKLLLSSGSNIIEIKAKDRFKKEVLKTIRVYYKQIQ